MTRAIVMLMRGGFRLVLGTSVALTVAWGLLWLAESARKNGVLGYETWLFGSMWLDIALWLGVALTAGLALAVACDRAWLWIRARGPRLAPRR